MGCGASCCYVVGVDPSTTVRRFVLAFSFGASAVAVGPLHLIERGDAGVVTILAPSLFIGANLFVGWLVIKTLARLFQGQLIARPVITRPRPAAP